jgi:S-adenosylmethionine synthetase
VQLAYAIGVAAPVSVMINTFGTGRIPSDRIAEVACAEFDMRPAAIIEQLDLLRPIYRKTAAYGHFGRELPEFTWERTDRVESLKSRAGI